MSSAVSLNDVTEGLATESVSLADVASEPGGAWPTGWYAAEIIEGYATAKGHQFTTQDSVSQRGDSRNLTICFRVANNGQERTMQESLNYRPSDFTAERIAFIKEARIEYKDARNWADKDAQRTSLAVAKIGQFQKALGLPQLALTPAGTIVAGVFVSHKVDVRLGVDENGYNVVTAFAPPGTKTNKRTS